MLNKKYLPGSGFVLLMVTLVFSGLFFKWALGPLSHEKAIIEEDLGHQFKKEGKNSEAFIHFLNAAEIEDDNISRSRRYSYAGSTSTSLEDRIKYLELAIKYNSENKIALSQLKTINKNNLFYIKRFDDGWSEGNNGKIQLIADLDSEYALRYFTSSPEKKEFAITVYLDNKIIKKKKIQSGKTYDSNIFLAKGEHEVSISINHTFNPEKLKMSEDNRDLGVHFEIEKIEVEK